MKEKLMKNNNSICKINIIFLYNPFSSYKTDDKVGSKTTSTLKMKMTENDTNTLNIVGFNLLV